MRRRLRQYTPAAGESGVGEASGETPMCYALFRVSNPVLEGTQVGLQRRQVAIVSVLVCLAIGWLVVTGMRDSMVFYYTVSEVVAAEESMAGEPLRVAGKVVPGSIHVSSVDHLDREFVIHEGGRELPVRYRGVTPDTLVDDAEAVVEGRLTDEGIFEATFVMAKCPSKYEGETDFEKYREAGVRATGATNP